MPSRMDIVGDDIPSVSSATSQSAFDRLLNFRDVGRTINEYTGEKLVRDGLLYRSARPDEATPRDRMLLRDDYGIKTVIDLRTKTEHINALEKRKIDLLTLGKSNSDLAEPLHIPGIQYHEIKITGRSFELFLLRQLTFWNLIKFFCLFLFGFRMRAIQILGREVMLPLGLDGLGCSTLDKSGPEIAQTLTTFIEPGELPVLVHCTQGKDRTGIIVILVLLILGVPVDVINYEYRLTDDAMQNDPEKETRLAEVREIGLTDDWGLTSKTLVTRTVQHLDQRYGGLEAYLDGIGFDGTRRNRLREVLRY